MLRFVSVRRAPGGVLLHTIGGKDLTTGDEGRTRSYREFLGVRPALNVLLTRRGKSGW